MSDELISRQAAIAKAFEDMEAFRAAQFQEWLDEISPVDAVEVVRCGECVNSREMDKYEKKLYLDGCVGCTRLSSSYNSIIMAPDDFCSYGRRVEENAAD